MEAIKYKVVVDGYTDLVECDLIKYNHNGSVCFVSGSGIIGTAPPQAYVMLETTDKKVFADELIDKLDTFLNYIRNKENSEIEKYKEEGHDMDSAAISFRRGRQTIIEDLNLLINQLVNENRKNQITPS